MVLTGLTIGNNKDLKGQNFYVTYKTTFSEKDFVYQKGYIFQ